jgi:hypothetical protein
MIVERIRGNVFETICRHILFGVNTEGVNDTGFAGQVSRRVGKRLADTGGNSLGEVLKFQAGGKVYHAVVCHSLSPRPGWTMTSQIIEKALNDLQVDDDEPIAAVLMGGGIIGQVTGADIDSHLAAIERSSKAVYVYSL